MLQLLVELSDTEVIQPHEAMVTMVRCTMSESRMAAASTVVLYTSQKM